MNLMRFARRETLEHWKIHLALPQLDPIVLLKVLFDHIDLSCLVISPPLNPFYRLALRVYGGVKDA